MLGRWKRIGELCDVPNCDSHKISFIADSLHAIITRIDISANNYYTDHSANYITLSFSPFFYEELIQVCQRLLIPYTSIEENFRQLEQVEPKVFTRGALLKATTYVVSIPFTESNLALVLRLFDHFNMKLQPHPFPRELTQQLIDVLHSASENKVTHFGMLAATETALAGTFDMIAFMSHNGRTVADTKQLTIRMNQSKLHTPRQAASQLAVGFLKSRIDPHYDPAFQQISSGADCDEQSYEGYSALSYAMVTQPSTQVMETLLFYRANPFKRPSFNGSFGKFSFSPYELAYVFGQHHKANIVISELTWLTRRELPQDKDHRRFKVTASGVTSSLHTVESIFCFNNQHAIRTKLKKVSQLTLGEDGEKQSVFALFKDNFESLNDESGEKLKKLFEHDFSGDKFIDLIYHHNSIVGFNLFEIIQPAEQKDKLFVHGAYSVIKPEYRGYGLMIFLSYRFAYALQMLRPDKRVGVVFCCIHYNSYRMVDFEHFPKYRTETFMPLVKVLLDAIYGCHYQYYHHLLTSYVIEDMKVRLSQKKSDSTSLNERIYQREILGYGDAETQSQPRSTPVIFFIGEDNFLHIHSVAYELGIDFGKHLDEYAHHLDKSKIGPARLQAQSVLKFSAFMRSGGVMMLENSTSKLKLINRSKL